MKQKSGSASITIEIGGHEVLVEGTGYAEVPATGLSGPPENYDEGSPAYFEPERFLLIVSLASKIDITDLINELAPDTGLIDEKIDDAWLTELDRLPEQFNEPD